jgi:hypothetical protein
MALEALRAASNVDGEINAAISFRATAAYFPFHVAPAFRRPSGRVRAAQNANLKAGATVIQPIVALLGGGRRAGGALILAVLADPSLLLGLDQEKYTKD